MTIQHKFSDLKFKFSLFREMLSFFRLLCRYNASIGTTHNAEKLRYLIARESHVFEKGLSLKNTRKGFGIAKALKLIDNIDHYIQLNSEDNETINYSINVLDKYSSHLENENTECHIIRDNVERLKSITKFSTTEAGINNVAASEIKEKAKLDFKSLVYSRHSIRYFSETPVDKSTISKAIELAQQTPSACNRQSWRTHVFFDKEAKSLIKWQGGAKGAENHISCAILVSTDLRGFFAHEPFQAYIDGGLYAMNLINALHYFGLGTLPLSCGYPAHKLCQLIHFGIPQNEIPIIVIATGNLTENVKFAVSTRLSIKSTNKFHNE